MCHVYDGEFLRRAVVEDNAHAKSFGVEVDTGSQVPDVQGKVVEEVSGCSRVSRIVRARDDVRKLRGIGAIRSANR